MKYQSFFSLINNIKESCVLSVVIVINALRVKISTPSGVSKNC